MIFLYIFEFFLKSLFLILPVLLSVAFITLAERKVLAIFQRRKGPNITGFKGIFQPLADGVKLIFKESIVPMHSNSIIFLLAPLITLSLSFMSWLVIPFGPGYVYFDSDIGILYLFAISSIGVYGIILSGWASNSRYAFLGALRSAAQMISYEVSLGLILMPVFLIVGSLNLSEVVVFQQHIWLCIPLFPTFILFIVSALAETNRPPFDLPEAEAELVSGYNVEYSAIGFAFFFIGEYANLILMSALTSICFLGGWLPFLGISIGLSFFFWFSVKVNFVLFIFIWVRAALPRYRYDQLMQLSWKTFLPLSLAWLVLLASLLIFFKGLPPIIFILFVACLAKK